MMEYITRWTTKSDVLHPQVSKTSQITLWVILVGGFDDVAYWYVQIIPPTISVGTFYLLVNLYFLFLRLQFEFKV